MSIRKVSFAPLEFYHIYNRGNSKQKIFHDKEDYKRFVALLYVCNQEDNFKIDSLSKDQGLFSVVTKNPLVAIGAYVLMPNHFHILITQTEGGDVSKFMQKFSTAYVMYYNKKYKHTGGLFEGKFKSKHLVTDKYLKYIFSYIHLNPVKLIESKWKESGIKDKTKAVAYLQKYEFSSYLDYSGVNRVENKVLNTSMFPKYLPKQKDFIREIFEWLSYKNEEV